MNFYRGMVTVRLLCTAEHNLTVRVVPSGAPSITPGTVISVVPIGR